VKRENIALTWSWTNWTFGVWYCRNMAAWGVDLGPFGFFYAMKGLSDD